MNKVDALTALAALGQETRLDVFRLLVNAGCEGMMAGAISEKLDVRANTLSTHLGILTRSGLIKAMRDGRAIWYKADIDSMQGLVRFLLQDCCGGNPALCGNEFETLLGSVGAPCCPSPETT